MAITQERMLKLIAAAENYRDQLRTLVESLELVQQKYLANSRSGEYPAEAAVQDCLYSLFNVAIRQDSAEVIAVERKHFSLMQKRNDYTRERARHQRFTAAHGQTVSEMLALEGRAQAQATSRTRVKSPEEFLREIAARSQETEPSKDAAEAAPPAKPEDVLEI